MVVNKNALVSVTKEFTFDSCHYLKMYEGKCANLHGHTYKLQVELFGDLDSRGMVVDFGDIKKVINELIIDNVDHKNLNEVYSFNTTAENMVVYFYEIISAYLRGINHDIHLLSVRLWETPTSFATYRGEEICDRCSK